MKRGGILRMDIFIKFKRYMLLALFCFIVSTICLGCKKSISTQDVEKIAYSRFNEFCDKKKITKQLLQQPKIRRIDAEKMWTYMFITKDNPHYIVIITIDDKGGSELSWDKREELPSNENA